jgi:hypothetical protein
MPHKFQRLQDGKLHWLFLANRLLKGSIIRFAAPRSDLPGGGYRTIHNAVGSMINWVCPLTGLRPMTHGLQYNVQVPIIFF